jgi:hypothetical protein
MNKQATVLLPKAVLVAKTTKRGERVQCMRVRYWHQFFMGISLITLQRGQKWYIRNLYQINFMAKGKGPFCTWEWISRKPGVAAP